MYSSDTTKYLIHIIVEAQGVVEKPDVVGAIFGQTEGLLGEDLDLRDLQRTGRVGRIDVQITSKKGETRGEILISSSLDRAETAILAASLETIDRVGPCVAKVSVASIEDIRVSKRKMIFERAKELLLERFDDGSIDSDELLDDVRESMRMGKIESIGDEKVPAGPHVIDSDAIIVVEGRADVINLLRYGIKNSVAVEGTHVPQTIVDLTEKKTATAFLDGDRGGELILRELLQVADIDYVAFSPRGKSVEDMARKEILKALRNKVPAEHVRDQIFGEESGGNFEQKVARLLASESSVASASESEERRQRAVAALQGQRKSRDYPQRVPQTLRDHMEDVRGQKISRFLSKDLGIVNETQPDNVEQLVESLGPEVVGLVTDQSVNQKLLDRLAVKGLEYVAARDFKGVIKRPLTIKLMKIT
ncbi:MAG: DNA primase DnaG [Methanoregulaceae archaeon]